MFSNISITVQNETEAQLQFAAIWHFFTLNTPDPDQCDDLNVYSMRTVKTAQRKWKRLFCLLICVTSQLSQRKRKVNTEMPGGEGQICQIKLNSTSKQRNQLVKAQYLALRHLSTCFSALPVKQAKQCLFCLIMCIILLYMVVGPPHAPFFPPLIYLSVSSADQTGFIIQTHKAVHRHLSSTST